MSKKAQFPATKSVCVPPAATPPRWKPTAMEVRPSRDEVGKEAYLIYLSQGHPQGLDVQHWIQAEVQTMALQKPGRGAVLT